MVVYSVQDVVKWCCRALRIMYMSDKQCSVYKASVPIYIYIYIIIYIVYIDNKMYDNLRITVSDVGIMFFVIYTSYVLTYWLANMSARYKE